jgi:hypothetical protein
VILRNLDITGAGSGVEGIYYPGGGTHDVENCTISGFTYDSIVNVTNGNSTMTVENTKMDGGATGVYINEDGGSTTIDDCDIRNMASYAVEVLNSPGTLTMRNTTIDGGGGYACAYGVDIQSSAYYGTRVFEASLDKVSIKNTSTAAFYVGVGNVQIKGSTIGQNSGVALEATTGGRPGRPAGP